MPLRCAWRTHCDGTGPSSGTDKEDEAEVAEQGISSVGEEEEEQVIAAEAAAENDGDWRTARRLTRQAIQISDTQASQEVGEDQELIFEDPEAIREREIQTYRQDEQ